MRDFYKILQKKMKIDLFALFCLYLARQSVHHFQRSMLCKRETKYVRAISRNRRVIGARNDATSRAAIFANVIVPGASIVRPRGAYLIVAIFAAESRGLSNNAGVDKGTRGFREMQLIRGDVTRGYEAKEVYASRALPGLTKMHATRASLRHPP